VYVLVNIRVLQYFISGHHSIHSFFFVYLYPRSHILLFFTLLVILMLTTHVPIFHYFHSPRSRTTLFLHCEIRYNLGNFSFNTSYPTHLSSQNLIILSSPNSRFILLSNQFDRMPSPHIIHRPLHNQDNF